MGELIINFKTETVILYKYDAILESWNLSPNLYSLLKEIKEKEFYYKIVIKEWNDRICNVEKLIEIAQTLHLPIEFLFKEENNNGYL